MDDSVRETYDRIAAHFSETRAYPWPEVETFVEDCPDGAVGLDVGCGNGRHARPLSSVVDRVVGVDVSRGLLREARDNPATGGLSIDLLQADASALPIDDDAVAVAVYVATLHHLPDRAARIASLDELARVLAPGGRGLVSAWSTVHDRFDDRADDATAGFDTTIDWTLPGGETVPRFYHIYAPDEFADDLARSDLDVVDAFVSSGNCYAEVRSR